MDSRTKNLALALLASTQFMIVIDASIVNVALPSIGTALEIDPESISWIVNAYTLTFGGFLLLGGRLADLLGRRRMFTLGLGLFAVASLLGGLAQTEAWLNAARAGQGLGAAIIAPAALSIVATTFAEGAERNRALGVWGAVSGAGGAAGVLLGGVLTESLGWEWVMFVNVPLALVAAALAPRLLVESRSDAGHRSFDIPGGLTVTAGLALLVYAIVDAESAGWTSSTTLVRLLGAAALLTAFVVIESRAAHPLMPFSIFRLRTLRGANVVGLLIGVSLLSMFFFVSLYLQQVLGYSALRTGVAYLPLSVCIIVSAAAASQLVTRIGFKLTLIIGLVCTAAGLLWFSRISADGSFVGDVLGPSLLAAVGLGLSFVTVTIAAVNGTEAREAGLASGLINTTQQLGGALGVAVLASVATSRTASFGAAAERDPVAITEGFQSAFLVGSGAAVVGALLAAVLISSRDAREHAADARAGNALTVA